MSERESTENSVSVLNWVVSFILLGIPLLNFILILVWAFGGTQYASKKTFAQATIVLWLIFVILFVIALLLLPMLGAGTQSDLFQQWLDQLQQVQTDLQNQSAAQPK